MTKNKITKSLAENKPKSSTQDEKSQDTKWQNGVSAEQEAEQAAACARALRGVAPAPKQEVRQEEVDSGEVKKKAKKSQKYKPPRHVYLENSSYFHKVACINYVANTMIINGSEQVSCEKKKKRVKAKSKTTITTIYM